MNIEVPYLPVNSFDVTTVSKYFPETSADKELNEYFFPDLETDDWEFADEILLILSGIGMEKYVSLFQKNRVTLDTFLQLDVSDLQEIGITDANDRQIIIKNLDIHRNINDNDIVPEKYADFGHTDDLRIIQNISHQLFVLRNYCAFIELQMKKHKLTDYIIDSEKSACTYLKAFTETALVQSNILLDTIYHQQNNDSLLDKILKANDLDLPRDVKKSLPKRKEKWEFCAYKVIAAIGITSVVILTANYFIVDFVPGKSKT